MRWIVSFASLLLASLAAAQPAPMPIVEPPTGPLEVMRADRPSACGFLAAADGSLAGELRFQCDPVRHVCLASATHERDASGKETGVALSRVGSCAPGDPRDAARQGYRFLTAIADSPPGWVRDARGRVMQLNFDLHRRLWLGGGAVLSRSTDGERRLEGEVDFGLRVDVPAGDLRSMTRLHLLEGRLDAGRGEIDATLLQLDVSHVFERPLLRITTFVGKPRRFDLDLDLGGWLELGRVEGSARGDPRQAFVTVIAAAPTLDLWRSADLDSYLRVRLGPGLGRDTLAHALLFTPAAGLDFEDLLDRDGFHRLYANAAYTRVWGEDRQAGRAAVPTRFEARAGYELILLAIDDQPLSLVAEGRARWRDDVRAVAPGWELSGLAGLRFSFWAPARRDAGAR